MTDQYDKAISKLLELVSKGSSGHAADGIKHLCEAVVYLEQAKSMGRSVMTAEELTQLLAGGPESDGTLNWCSSADRHRP